MFATANSRTQAGRLSGGGFDLKAKKTETESAVRID
jgi:hypothetical protein